MVQCSRTDRDTWLSRFGYVGFTDLLNSDRRQAVCGVPVVGWPVTNIVATVQPEREDGQKSNVRYHTE
jgi:hypothetical protein